jgi:hypothetical protein
MRGAVASGSAAEVHGVNCNVGGLGGCCFLDGGLCDDGYGVFGLLLSGGGFLVFGW